MKNQTNENFSSNFSKFYDENPEEGIGILEVRFLIDEIEFLFTPLHVNAGGFGFKAPHYSPRCHLVFRNSLESCQNSSIDNVKKISCFSFAFRRFQICRNLSSENISSQLSNSEIENKLTKYPILLQSYTEAKSALKKCIKINNDTDFAEEKKSMKVMKKINKLKAENLLMSL